MLERYGDLWTFGQKNVVRCVTTNGVVRSNGRLVMGAGVARQAAIVHPGIDKRLGKLVAEFGNIPHYLEDINIISFPTKNKYYENSDFGLIAESASRIVEIADKHQLGVIISTRPGCGNGGLFWEHVRDVVVKIFDDRFIIVNNT